MAGLRCAVDIAPLGELADPQAIVRLADEAEEAGWHGLSLWDTLGVSMASPAPDPFVALAAVASATRSLRLITSVIALPRRRPQLVAQAAATLDAWSLGRLTLGVGAGADPADFQRFGDGAAWEARIEGFDTALAELQLMLGGDGPGKAVAGPSGAQGSDVPPIGPACVQRPRPPIWMGGMRPGALRRAARLEGWIAIATSEDGASMALSAAAFGAMAERLAAERAAIGRSRQPSDIAVLGFGEPGEGHPARAFAEAGATWWLESLSPMRGSLEELIRIVRAGPPVR